MEGLGHSVKSQKKGGKKHTDVLRPPFTLRIAFYVSLYFSFIASLIGISSGFAKERIVDYVVAVVNDQPITLHELETELILIAVISNSLIILSEQENTPNIQKIKNPPNAVKRTVLEALIEQKLMLQKADDIGILLWSWGQKVNTEIQGLKSLYRDETLFFKDLKRLGLEYQEVEERLRTALIVKELTVRQFRSSIDEEQINQQAPQYFEEHRSEFIEPAQIQFQSILIRSKPDDTADLQNQVKTLAKTITSQLQTGVTFQEIQQAYPDNPLLQIVTEPQTLPTDTEVRLAIADLEVNEVSQPIPTPEGYLIAKLLKKEPARQKTYPEVSQEIQNKLIGEDLQKQRKAWLTEQKAAADIRILDSELAKTPLPVGATEDQD